MNSNENFYFPYYFQENYQCYRKMCKRNHRKTIQLSSLCFSDGYEHFSLDRYSIFGWRLPKQAAAVWSFFSSLPVTQILLPDTQILRTSSAARYHLEYQQGAE